MSEYTHRHALLAISQPSTVITTFLLKIINFHLRL